MSSLTTFHTLSSDLPFDEIFLHISPTEDFQSHTGSETVSELKETFMCLLKNLKILPGYHPFFSLVSQSYKRLRIILFFLEFLS